MNSTAYLELIDIQELTLEINTACNAACPGCARQYNSVFKSRTIPHNIHFPIELWKTLLTQLTPANNLKTIRMCGNYGDAAATHYLSEMLDILFNIKPNVTVEIDSNMGLGSQKFWQRLGSFNNVVINASIDGLADTNHIYRRFVNWDTVIQNCKTLIESGGIVYWKYIVFPWNSHQVDTARTLSQDMNFTGFFVSPNNQPHMNDHVYKLYKDMGDDEWNNKSNWKIGIDNTIDPIDNIPEYKASRIYELLNGDNLNISCHTQKTKTIHVNWDGTVWPCCWYGAVPYHEYPPYRAAFKLVTPQEQNWNNLNYYTLDEILNHNFYRKDLMLSQKYNPSIQCVEVCNKCNK